MFSPGTFCLRRRILRALTYRRQLEPARGYRVRRRLFRSFRGMRPFSATLHLKCISYRPCCYLPLLGFPYSKDPSSTSRTTQLPMPMTQLCPIFNPSRTDAPIPIRHRSPIVTLPPVALFGARWLNSPSVESWSRLALVFTMENIPTVDSFPTTAPDAMKQPDMIFALGETFA